LSWDHPASHPISRLPKRKRKNRATQRFWKLTYSVSEGKFSPSGEPVLEGRKCRFALFSPQTQIEVQKGSGELLSGMSFHTHPTIACFSSHLASFCRLLLARIVLCCTCTMLCWLCCAAAAVFDTSFHPIPISKGKREKKASWLYLFGEVFLVLLDRSGWEHKTLFVLCVIRCVCGTG